MSKSYPEDSVERLAKTNCPAVLYSTAREMLVTVVRRSPYIPVLIPSVTFLEINKNNTDSNITNTLVSKSKRRKKPSKEQK